MNEKYFYFSTEFSVNSQPLCKFLLQRYVRMIILVNTNLSVLHVIWGERRHYTIPQRNIRRVPPILLGLETKFESPRFNNYITPLLQIVVMPPLVFCLVILSSSLYLCINISSLYCRRLRPGFFISDFNYLEQDTH